MQSTLDTPSVYEKLKIIENECQQLLSQSHLLQKPAGLFSAPARDILVLPRQQLPSKKGLQSAEGQARLLHDLANIELQAMELGLRTLYNFPNADPHFREQLVNVVLDEAKHLTLCLKGIEHLGFDWGFVPVHNQLWDATHNDDTFLDRILIVHCYLEGSGLDSGELILQKLNGVENRTAREIVKVIASEEVGHVKFGTSWFQKTCAELKLDCTNEFTARLASLKSRIPKRAAKINPAARLAAGFNSDQISYLKSF